MSKGFEYNFEDNCKDIVEHLKDSTANEEIEVRKAAEYVVSCLEEQPSEPKE